MKSVILETN